MRLRHIVFFITVLCTCFNSTYGQDPYYINISTNNGLPSNTVYCITQDSKGFIWVAHAEGLSRFDGHEFKTYTCDEQTSKPGTNINEDKLGRIWYQNFDGYLYYVENDSMYPLEAQRPALGFTPYGLIDSVLITIDTRSFNYYDVNTLKIKKSILDTSIGYINAVCGNNKYYATFGNTIYTLTADAMVTKRTIENRYPVLAHQGRVFTMDRSSFDGWAYEHINGTETPFFNLKNARFIQACMFTDDNYWFCTTEGVWGFKPNGAAINNNKAFFKRKNISEVYKDREGNYWFGTLNEGILFVPNLNTRLTEIPGSAPSAIVIDEQSIYVATNKNEIFDFNPLENKLQLKYKDNLTHEVLTFEKDTVSNKFILVAQWFKVLDKNFKELFSYPRATKDATIVNNKYYALSATGIAGLYKQAKSLPNSWDSLFNSSETTAEVQIASLFGSYRFNSVEYSPHSSAVYYASNNGLYKVTAKGKGTTGLTINNKQVYATQLKLYKQNIYAITPRNTLLIIDSNDKISAANTDAGLRLYKMFVVDGRLIVLTNKGIKRYDSSSNTFVASEMLKGIMSEEIKDIKCKGDILYVATNRGIITTPAHAITMETNPIFNITSVTVNGHEQILDKSYLLKHDENNLEIKYSILSYQNPGSYSLYYKINNGKWIQSSKASGSLKFASLSPGSYNISFSIGEPVSTQPLTEEAILFEVQHPFWGTAWFWSLAIILIASLAYTYYKWQTGILKKQNQLLTEKVELERNLHKSVLTSIRSQMNPHFFYNALNTIQSFIITDDKRNASTYLSKFSKLTRTILEMTEKETITLSEEINALKLYLDIEKVRFNNEFQYAVNVTKGLETDAIKIPSMIVQPYIENSLKHGLLHKQGEKRLLVDFLKSDGNLSIIIDDNGIGRKTSIERNKIRTDKHKPFATEANMKRIEILNKGNKNIGVVYTDKTDAFGQSNGTIVTITIPLIKE